MKQFGENWPGLASETKQICQELNIENCNLTLLNKREYKVILTKACHIKNEQILRATASEVKCNRIRQEPYGKKTYTKLTTIEESRKWFKSCFGLLPFAGNFTHDRRFAKTGFVAAKHQERRRVILRQEFAIFTAA